MSSIVERLTEGIVNRDMRAESHALLAKWERTGLLEGLGNDRKKQAMSRLLENQAKELLRENSSMSAGDVEGFAAVAFPIVRRVFAGLIANDLVSVQPMSLPSGLIFFLDFVFSPNLGAKGSEGHRLGNQADKSIYGTNQVGAQITGGVDLVGALKQDLGGPRTVGARGYAYASPTGSSTMTTGRSSEYQVLDSFSLTGSTEAQKKMILWDPDLIALSSSGTARWVARIDIAASTFSQLDYDTLGAISASINGLNDAVQNNATIGITAANTGQLRRLTQITGSDRTANRVQLYFISSQCLDGLTGSADGASWTIDYPITDNFRSVGTAMGAIEGTTTWGLEGSDDIPEIDIKVDSIAVTAQTKKLKAKWTPELGQDLNAYHNLDAEVELTSILSEQIALEIDREILGDLVNGATAATYYWSRAPGLFLNRETGVEIGASSAAPDFTGTVSEWYETLAETINDVSAQIHRKTLRGGANFVVCGPEVANILEFTAGFRASVTHDDETGSIGAVKVGSLSKKFDVIVDPYFLRNVVLVGRRGSSFLESGYVYAPYVPLQTTPTIFGPEDFVPRKGVMTRYAKKMVRPDLYGLVVIRGLIGEAGATS
tara:strand:- start:2147 stop:3955 length:1809 start_codon:yes stop_codon:yes gene_type:complete